MRRLRTKLLLVLMGLLVLAGGLISVRTSDVVCHTSQGSCTSEVTQALAVFKGKSFFFTDEAKVFQQESVLTHYRLVKVEKHLPGTLVIELQPYLTGYQLYFPEGDKTWVVNSQRALAEQKLDSLPTITSKVPLEKLQEDNTLKPEFHQAFTDLVSALTTTNLQYQEIILESETVIRISLEGNISGIISTDTPQTQLTQLAFIQHSVDLASYDQGIQVIDLRYRLPVLRTTYTW